MSSSSSTSSFHVVKAGTGSASSTSERKQSSGSGELEKSHDSTASSGWMTPWRKKRKSKGQADGSDEMEVFADVNIFNVLLAGANGRCFVFLARESQPGQREDGDHTVFVFE